MFKLLCFFLGMLFLFHVEKASAIALNPIPKKNHTVLNIDSTVIKTRSFNNTALQEYAKQKDFIYTEAPPEGRSWWSRFWSWVWGLLERVFGKIFSGTASWFIFKTLLFILAALALAFIIFKILGIDVIQIIRGESKGVEIPYGESLENIHDINFDNEIENAISSRNYRLAVRLLYLRCLKQLSDAQLIHWQIDKTNAAYLTELGDTKYRQLFGVLTSQFEYIWYGDFPVDVQSFQNINALFADFKKGLS